MLKACPGESFSRFAVSSPSVTRLRYSFSPVAAEVHATIRVHTAGPLETSAANGSWALLDHSVLRRARFGRSSERITDEQLNLTRSRPVAWFNLSGATPRIPDLAGVISSPWRPS
jgi:hypothetical protein